MNLRNCLKFIILIALTTVIFGKTKVTNVKYDKQGKFGRLTVKFNGELATTPELMVRDKLVQIELPNTVVWPKIERKVSINKSYDSTVSAYQYNKNLTRVRVELPYMIKGKEDQVSVVLNDKDIQMYFPLVPSSGKRIKKALKTAQKKGSTYDESYLDKLLKEKESSPRKELKKVIEIEKDLNNEITAKKAIDRITTSASAVNKENGFDFSKYIMKFVGFFALLIGGIYIVMNFFRKGVLKKSNLGIFSSAKMVEVLSTTYLGPKRSILVVRVHDQVFLMAQSEKGMDFLTEINDTTAFIKDGEKNITGTNFDSQLSDASIKDKDLKIKEASSSIVADLISGPETEVSLSSQVDQKTKITNGNDIKSNKISLSNQIKKKVKSLKQLQ